MKHDIELQPSFTQIQSKDQAITAQLHSLGDSLFQTTDGSYGSYGLSLKNVTLEELKANLDKQTQLHAVLSKPLESRLSTLKEVALEKTKNLTEAIKTVTTALKRPELRVALELLNIKLQSALTQKETKNASEVLNQLKVTCPSQDIYFYFVRREITGIKKEVQSMMAYSQDMADVAKKLSEQSALIIAAMLIGERETLSRDHTPVSSSSSSSESLSNSASSFLSDRSSPAFFPPASFGEKSNGTAVQMNEMNR